MLYAGRMRLVLAAAAVLLLVGAGAWIGIAALHFWMSSGPPIPQPRDVFFERAWIDLGVAAVFAILAGAALWFRPKKVAA